MRLLLAEDEEALSKALVTILKHNNYAVDAVFDGQQALDYLECGIYDGLILDLMMPKVDGITVLKTIRRKGNKIPVLILTAKSEVDDKVFGLDCGADDYLTKPFVTKELLARIRAMTRRQSDLQDNALVYGDLRLDRTSFELISQKVKLLLTAKEFQIMEMFMMNPKCISSAEQLGTGERNRNQCGVDLYFLSAQKAQNLGFVCNNQSGAQCWLYAGGSRCLKNFD